MSRPPLSPPLDLLRLVELRQLRYFLLLAEQLHFRRAAEIACITQPAISRQIAQLEDVLGVPLFDRGGRRVTLTAAGEGLYAQLIEALSSIELALLDAGKHRQASRGPMDPASPDPRREWVWGSAVHGAGVACVASAEP